MDPNIYVKMLFRSGRNYYQTREVPASISRIPNKIIDRADCLFVYGRHRTIFFQMINQHISNPIKI